MYQRIIEIETPGTRVRLSGGQIRIESPGRDAVLLPAETCAVLILATPAVSLSGAALSALAERGAITLFCDAKHLPSVVALPCFSGCAPPRVLQLQTSQSLPSKKRVWRDLVRRKIRNQALLLSELGLDAAPLNALADAVKPGDPDNVEARAARLYWRALKIVPKRERTREDANLLLNYAYAILCASTARALCASGLHLALGVHHHNRCNPYCLASDMMEPYRAFAERAVIACLTRSGDDDFLCRENRLSVADFLTNARVEFGKEFVAITTALRRTAASFLEVLGKSAEKIELPGGRCRHVAVRDV